VIRLPTEEQFLENPFCAGFWCYLYTLLCFGASIKEGIFMQQEEKPKRDASNGHTYRFFADPGHGWLEVPRAEVVESGAKISAYSYYDPATDRAYLEEDCDAPAFLAATGMDWGSAGRTLHSSAPRRLPRYGIEAFIDSHIFVIRPDNTGTAL
jgi:hypothetical protein